MKYTPEIVETICSLVASGEWTNQEICLKVDITEETFYNWKKEKIEFSENLKRANEKRLEKFKVEARKSALKKITGFTVDEVRTTWVDDGLDENGNPKPKVKEKTITKKYFPPDTGMIIFTLTNTDKENFKNTQHIDHTTKDKEIQPANFLDLSQLPDDTIRELVSAIKRRSDTDSQ